MGYITNSIFDQNSIKCFNNFFIDLPYTVELYDSRGILRKTNQEQNEFWKLHEKDIVNHLNILEDVNVCKSGLNTFVETAISGESVVVMSHEYNYKLLSNDDNGSLYESTFIPLQGRRVLRGIIAIHRKIPSEMANIDANIYRHQKQHDSPAYSFLSNVSHELRTPLNWILGFSELIRSEMDIVKIKEYNNTVIRGSKHLLSLIEMLIDMSMIIKNDLQLTLTEVNLNTLASEMKTVAEDELSLINKSIKIGCNINFDVSSNAIVTDKQKLQQILLNLIHNSLKFTEQGFIEIGGINRAPDEYIFYVKDTGIGIPASKQKYIFDMFRRGDESSSSPYNGQGLGLTICKDYARILGGRIWLESEYGSGSTFFFSIKNQFEKLMTDKPVISGF